MDQGDPDVWSRERFSYRSRVGPKSKRDSLGFSVFSLTACDGNERLDEVKRPVIHFTPQDVLMLEKLSNTQPTFPFPSFSLWQPPAQPSEAELQIHLVCVASSCLFWHKFKQDITVCYFSVDRRLEKGKGSA